MMIKPRNSIVKRSNCLSSNHHQPRSPRATISDWLAQKLWITFPPRWWVLTLPKWPIFKQLPGDLINLPIAVSVKRSPRAFLWVNKYLQDRTQQFYSQLNWENVERKEPTPRPSKLSGRQQLTKNVMCSGVHSSCLLARHPDIPHLPSCFDSRREKLLWANWWSP